MPGKPQKNGITLIAKDKTLKTKVDPKRYVWIQVARGSLKVNGKTLQEGDAAAIWKEKQVVVKALEGAELLWFDLP